jgi:light-regulated signal transduction histidine kinase (bacteriophytochrome)
MPIPMSGPFLPVDQAQANRDLARRSERLAVAMRELELFSFGIAHDFRAPLHAIDAIVRGIEDDRLRPILAYTAAMEATIEKLLAFCRVSPSHLEVETIDMEALVREAWTNLENTTGVVLSVATLPAARGHRAMLALAWSCLLGNAVKYSAKADRPHVEVTGGESPDHVVYGVRDNGAGFDLGYSGKLSHVFERLDTAAEYAGTGVNLAIVQRIVTRHYGNLWVDAQAGGGAFFQFSLPMTVDR